MADTGKPYNLIIPTEYNNDWYSAFVSLIQSIATVVGISEAQMSNCHDYKFLIQDINERLKSHIDSQDTVLDLKTALTKLDLGYGLNQLNVMWDALQAFNWNKRYLSDFDNVKGADIPAIFSSLNVNHSAFHAYKSVAIGQQTISNNTMTQVTFNLTDFDADGCFSSNAFTSKTKGFYVFGANIEWVATVDLAEYAIHIGTPEGTAYRSNYLRASGTGFQSCAVNGILNLGVGSSIAINVLQLSGVDQLIETSLNNTHFYGYRIA